MRTKTQTPIVAKLTCIRDRQSHSTNKRESAFYQIHLVCRRMETDAYAEKDTPLLQKKAIPVSYYSVSLAYSLYINARGLSIGSCKFTFCSQRCGVGCGHKPHVSSRSSPKSSPPPRRLNSLFKHPAAKYDIICLNRYGSRCTRRAFGA